MTHQQWVTLTGHHFADGRGHGAVLLAGTAPGSRGPRLLGRELLLAEDGKDYVTSAYGRHALDAAFVRNTAERARREGLVYLSVHNHASRDRVAFSKVDMTSHQRGYPALAQLTGQTVGGLVFTPYAAAGDLWFPDGSRSDLAEVNILTSNLLRLRPIPAARSSGHEESRYDRQARLFGDAGQEALGRLRVAVVGLGGVGSVLVELLARLGVGHLVLIDDDSVDVTNLPRLIAAEPSDVGKAKTEPAIRNARRANPDIQLTAINQRVEHPTAREELALVDWIFLAADGAAARYIATEIGSRYLIPITQMGVKIPVHSDTGDVGQVHAVTRPLLPGEGCLWCGGFINPTELAIDLHSERDRQAARYVAEAPTASVIGLNTLTAAEAVNHFTFSVTGLHDESSGPPTWILHRPRTSERDHILTRSRPGCDFCNPHGVLGRGHSPFAQVAA
ncbi:ThiF family adenylyltransferase [Streptosporangium subroseum]|uniref:ThiF family adenylyltransferase n=1 Tax=Streptosporangium subroseum TaxID=106412 RepID=UPI00308DBE96|nr:ThiF family adenylyltransferase [Streptosporangium subroseum]